MHQPPSQSCWQRTSHCSQFHWGDSLLVTDGLEELVPLLLSGIFTACHPLSAFRFEVVLVSMQIGTLGSGGPGRIHLHEMIYFPSSLFSLQIFPKSFLHCLSDGSCWGNHNYQANPHIHQQHIVWATTFRSGWQPLSSQMAIWLDKGWGNPDRNVVAQTICCWWMCGFAW